MPTQLRVLSWPWPTSEPAERGEIIEIIKYFPQRKRVNRQSCFRWRTPECRSCRRAKDTGGDFALSIPMSVFEAPTAKCSACKLSQRVSVPQLLSHFFFAVGFLLRGQLEVSVRRDSSPFPGASCASPPSEQGLTAGGRGGEAGSRFPSQAGTDGQRLHPSQAGTDRRRFQSTSSASAGGRRSGRGARGKQLTFGSH